MALRHKGEVDASWCVVREEKGGAARTGTSQSNMLLQFDATTARQQQLEIHLKKQTDRSQHYMLKIRVKVHRQLESEIDPVRARTELAS